MRPLPLARLRTRASATRRLRRRPAASLPCRSKPRVLDSLGTAILRVLLRSAGRVLSVGIESQLVIENRASLRLRESVNYAPGRVLVQRFALVYVLSLFLELVNGGCH